VPIGKPGRVLLHNIPLEFVRSRVAGGGRKSVDVSIALIPFIDFLIVLVIFLLISFSSSGDLAAPDIELPNASNTDPLETAPAVVISAVVVSLDGRRIADTASLAGSPTVERIEPLVQALETIRRNWSILHPSQPFPGVLILQADRTIDFRVIKKVMFSAAQAGYGNVSFAVNQRGST